MSDKNNSTKLRKAYSPDIIDEVITFANADGGVIYIGIREDNTVLGIPNPQEVAAQASNDIVNGITPQIFDVVQVRTVQLNGKELVAVMVNRGTNKPYSRIGAAVAERHAAELPSYSPANSFDESAGCTLQLGFSSLGLAMEAAELEANDSALRALGITDAAGDFTQLALLLSEQCPYTLRITTYEGSDKSSMKYSGTVSGSVIRQLAETCRLIEKLAPECYPADAVSEAVLNALIHRDYSFSGSTLVNMYDDRLEIISPGGLPAGLSMAAVELGISQPRYPKLANTLCSLELMELCGSGIGRIRGLYAKHGSTPLFEMAADVFRVTLPNLRTSAARRDAPDGYKALVLARARDKGFVVRSDVEELAGLKTTAAYNLIKELVADGLLTPSGVGKKTIYKPLG